MAIIAPEVTKTDEIELNPYAQGLFDNLLKYKEADGQTRRIMFEGYTYGLMVDIKNEYLRSLNQFFLWQDEYTGLQGISNGLLREMSSIVEYYRQMRDHTTPKAFMTTENIEIAQKLDNHYKATTPGIDTEVSVHYDLEAQCMEIFDPEGEASAISGDMNAIASNLASYKGFALTDQTVDSLFPYQTMTNEEKFYLFMQMLPSHTNRLFTFDKFHYSRSDIARFYQNFFAQGLWKMKNLARLLVFIDDFDEATLKKRLRHMMPFSKLFSLAQRHDEYKELLKMDHMQAIANAYLKYGNVVLNNTYARQPINSSPPSKN